MGSSRDCICSNFYHTHHQLTVSLKRKTDNISIIIRHMATEKRARAIVMLQPGAGRRQVTHFSRKCLQIPVSHWQMPQFTTKQTELIIFRSPVISNADIQRSGAYADGHRKRYVLLLLTKGFCSLCCSHTPYDGGNVVCFSFQWNIQQMSCEIKIAANATFRAPRSFRIFEQFPRCTFVFSVYLINYHWIWML